MVAKLQDAPVALSLLDATRCLCAALIFLRSEETDLDDAIASASLAADALVSLTIKTSLQDESDNDA